MDESIDWEIDQLFTNSLTDTVTLTAQLIFIKVPRHPSRALTARSFRMFGSGFRLVPLALLTHLPC